MPANRNALIRYKTIDNCLRNPYRRWTLEDLVDACSDALYEYEGIDKGISKRTVQMDIQMMRSEKLGYNAPIVVYENKYYKYEDPEYSITQTPLNEQDLKTMSEAVEVLRQFKGFSYFTEMSDIINRLEDHVASARMKTTPVIDFEKNEIVRGGIKTKKRKETPMVFPDFVAPVLHELCEESKSRVGNICCINKDNFYKRYYECLELAGVQKLPPYSCRHTTATALAMKNIDPFTIKEIMRHTKITTTQRYVHPDMKGMVDAVNQLQNDSPE
nr:MAG TPA: Integrase [Caudoviricetes sp.]